MSFSEDLINGLALKLNNIIDKYKALDDYSPFTLEIFDNCKNIIKDHQHKILLQNDYIVEKEKLYFKNIEALINNFQNEKISLERASKAKIKEITTETEENLEKLAIDEQNKIALLNEKINQYEAELKEFLDTSLDNIKMFETERNEKINSYDFQIKNATITYNDNVEIYNEELNEKIQKENLKFEKEMDEYEESISKIKDRYNEKILNANLELNDFSSNFSMVQAKQRDAKRDEAIELNNRIRILYDDNNRLLQEEKTNYEKDKTVNKIEKDRKHQDYILKSRQISNEFFLSMKKLNEKSNISKLQYQKSVSLTKKRYQSKLFNINKIYENDIKAIIEENNKYTSKEKEKAAASSFYKNNKATKKLESNEILELNDNYHKILTIDNYEKKKVDIHRKYNLAAIDELETRDTKYFQEVSNSDENEYSFKTKMLKYSYNEKANKIRYEASLKGIDTDSMYEKENALYQKNIQILMNNVKKTKNELDSVKELNEKVKMIEKKRHDTNVNFLTVFYLLEIEKIRTLDEFNHKAYNLNKLNSNTIYKYSKKNIEIQNDRKIAIKNALINVDKAQHAQDMYDISCQRNNITEKNDYNINLEKNDYSFKSTLNLHSFFKDRFVLELKIINDLLSSYVIVSKYLESLLISLINECSTANLTNNNFDFFKGLIIEFNKELLEMMNGINNTFLANINVYVEDRSKFESDYKFNSIFEEIHGDYKSKVNNILDQMAQTEEKIRTNDYIIAECNKAISTLKSQAYYISEQASKNNKKESKKKVNDLNQEIAQLDKKIKKIKESSIPLNEKMNELNQVLQGLNTSYDKQTKKLDDIESRSTEAYYELKKKFNQTMLSLKDDTPTLKTSLNPDNYINRFEEKRIEHAENTNKIISNLYDALKVFSDNVNNSYQNEYNMIIENNNNEIKILKNERLKVAKALGKELKKERETNAKNVNDARSFKRSIEVEYLKTTKAFNKEYDKALQDILFAQNFNMQKFYDDYYAVESNQKDIVDNYYVIIKKLDEESINLKTKIVHDVEASNNKLDAELKKFLHSKDVLIKNIPNEVKDKKENLKNDNIKSSNDLVIQRHQARIQYVKQKNESNRLIYEINMAYRQRLLMVKKNKKHEERKALRHHNYELKDKSYRKNTTL